MTKKHLHIIAFILILALVLGSKNVAHAAKQTLTLTPTSAPLVVKPGQTSTGNFQVVNQGDGGYDFTVYSADYSVKNEDYDPSFIALPGKPDVASWLKFSTTGGTLQPGQSATVTYKLSVPPNTPPGGYYAVAFAQTKKPKQTTGNSGIILIERVGEVFYLQVAGPVTQKGKLASWQSSWLQKPPLTAMARLENSGGTHYTSTVDIKVQDIFGGAKYTLNTKKVILPQTIRKIPVSWPHTPSIGLFKVSGTVTVLGKTEVLPTKYILVLSQTARIVLLIIVIVLLLLLILRYGIRRIKRTKKTQKLKKVIDTQEG